MPENLQPTFRALADPTRRDILHMLGDQDMTIAEVTAHFDITRAAVKKHLNVLKEGDLIRVRVKGRERINSLYPDGLKPILDWLTYFDQFWDERLLSLKNSIENEELTND